MIERLNASLDVGDAVWIPAADAVFAKGEREPMPAVRFGGDSPEETHLPVFVVGPHLSSRARPVAIGTLRAFASAALALLGIPIPAGLTGSPLLVDLLRGTEAPEPHASPAAYLALAVALSPRTPPSDAVDMLQRSARLLPRSRFSSFARVFDRMLYLKARELSKVDIAHKALDNEGVEVRPRVRGRQNGRRPPDTGESPRCERHTRLARRGEKNGALAAHRQSQDVARAEFILTSVAGEVVLR